MKIVVGLGNPGAEYARTRHNVGFMIVDKLARRHAAQGTKKRFRSELAEVVVGGQKVVLVKPQTYMNLSGHAVREAVNWYRAPLEDVLIVFDDLDLPFGTLRLRASGSAGGHNGLTSVLEQLGTNKVPRMRVGIGRGRSGAIGHVLTRFSPDQERELPNVIDRATDAVELWISDGIIAAMNQANRRVDEPQAAESTAG